MLDSKYETHNKAGLKTAANVLKAYSISIIQIKQSSGRGVNIAHEERLQKCESVIEAYWELSKSKSYLKSLKREGEVKEIAVDLHK